MVLCNMLGCVRRMQPSIELHHQLADWEGGAGRPAGHGTKRALRIVPRWVQEGKGSGHPFVDAIFRAAEFGTASLEEGADQRQFQEAAQRVIYGTADLQRAYKEAVAGMQLPPLACKMSAQDFDVLELLSTIPAANTSRWMLSKAITTWTSRRSSDLRKTAFSCHRGLDHDRRMPFGLKNAPAHFQRFMERHLPGRLRSDRAAPNNLANPILRPSSNRKRSQPGDYRQRVREFIISKLTESTAG